MMESINPKSLDFIKMLAPHFRWSCRAPLKTCFLDASPHYCTSATIIHCILDKALLSILCLSSMSLFVIYHHFLCNSGDHRRPVREEREKAKRKREGERWQWLKSRKVSGDLFLPAPKKKKKKKHMWGCHFLILSSNALWRKFVKLDQGRLKLVYKGVREGRRRRNVVHLRRLRCLQSARLGGTDFFPLLFFRVAASAVRCHVFWHFALERMRGKKWCGEGGLSEGMQGEDGNSCFFCSQSRRGVMAFFLRGMCSQIVS